MDKCPITGEFGNSGWFTSRHTAQQYAETLRNALSSPQEVVQFITECTNTKLGAKGSGVACAINKWVKNKKLDLSKMPQGTTSKEEERSKSIYEAFMALSGVKQIIESEPLPAVRIFYIE